MFSIPYVVSVALRSGECSPRAFDEISRNDPDVRRLATKVNVSVDDALDAQLPEHRAARLTVHWAAGGVTVVEMENPIGDADFHPLSDDELLAKSAALLGSRDQALLVRDLSRELLLSGDVSPVLASLRHSASKAENHEG
jgi:2-methylcitrate dehydratase PrpD